jgi:hypothetical protein
VSELGGVGAAGESVEEAWAFEEFGGAAGDCVEEALAFEEFGGAAGDCVEEAWVFDEFGGATGATAAPVQADLEWAQRHFPGAVTTVLPSGEVVPLHVGDGGFDIACPYPAPRPSAVTPAVPFGPPVRLKAMDWSVVLRELLASGYHDQALLSYLHSGFPIVVRDIVGLHFTANYPLHRDAPEEVIASHIAALVADGSIVALGTEDESAAGFARVCAKNGFSRAVCSPLLVVQKRANSIPIEGKWRVLLDATYSGVNPAITAKGSMSLPTHGDFARDAQDLWNTFPDDVIQAFKLDVQSAFYILPLLPAHRPLSCFAYKGTFYMYLATMMGVGSVPHFFQRTSVALGFLLWRHLHRLRMRLPRLVLRARTFLDDFISLTLSSCGLLLSQVSFIYFSQTLLVPINLGKYKSEGAPTSQPTVLGLVLNMSIAPFSLELTEERRSAVLEVLRSWQGRVMAPLRKMQSLLGVLQFVLLAVPVIAPALFSLRAAIGEGISSGSLASVVFRAGLRLDFMELSELIAGSRGARLLWEVPTMRRCVGWTDSSTSEGCGGFAVLGDVVYHYALQWTVAELGLIGTSAGSWSISPLETLAVAYLLQGLALCAPAGMLAGVSQIGSDNSSTVGSCSKLRARSCALTNAVISLILRGLLRLDDAASPLRSYSHKLAVHFVKGTENVAADDLSRNKTDSFLAWLCTPAACAFTQRADIAALPCVDMGPALVASRLTLVEISAQVRQRHGALRMQSGSV